MHEASNTVPTNEPDPYLTAEEAAAIPKVHPQTVRLAFREGRLRGIKINGSHRLRFRRSWVYAWLEGADATRTPATV